MAIFVVVAPRNAFLTPIQDLSASCCYWQKSWKSNDDLNDSQRNLFFTCTVKASLIGKGEKNYLDSVGKNTGAFVFCFSCVQLCKTNGNRKEQQSIFVICDIHATYCAWYTQLLRKAHFSADSCSSRTTCEVHKKWNVWQASLCLANCDTETHTLLPGVTNVVFLQIGKQKESTG